MTTSTKENLMKRAIVCLILLACATGCAVASASAAPCSTSTTSVKATRWERVPLRRHGHVVYHRVHGHRRPVLVRKQVHYTKHVQHFNCVGTTPAAATPAEPSPAPKKLHAHIDPSFVQSATNPLDVTYSYSASATTEEASPALARAADATPAELPEGVLDLYSDGSLACSINVGGPDTGGECPVTYRSTGTHTVVVTYISGSTTATETSTEQIEPFTTTTTVSAPYTPLEQSQLEQEVSPEPGVVLSTWKIGTVTVSAATTPAQAPRTPALEGVLAAGTYSVQAEARCMAGTWRVMRVEVGTVSESAEAAEDGAIVLHAAYAESAGWAASAGTGAVQFTPAITADSCSL
jgi:hypothetical protein